MEEHKLDLQHLISFLKFAKDNGYINPGTANNRIRAVTSIFNIVKNVDTSDITKIDLDNLTSRYNVLAASKIKSVTMRGNLDHLRGAIREFNRYLTDPANYTPESGRKKSVTSKTPSKKLVTTDKPTTSQKPPLTDISPPIEGPPILKYDSRMPSLHIDIQVHISPQSTDTQIDKVFESMAKHLKDLYNTTKSTE